MGYHLIKVGLLQTSVVIHIYTKLKLFKKGKVLDLGLVLNLKSLFQIQLQKVQDCSINLMLSTLHIVQLLQEKLLVKEGFLLNMEETIIQQQGRKLQYSKQLKILGLAILIQYRCQQPACFLSHSNLSNISQDNPSSPTSSITIYRVFQ